MAVMRLKEEQDVEKEPQQKQEEDEFEEEAFLLEGRPIRSCVPSPWSS